MVVKRYIVKKHCQIIVSLAKYPWTTQEIVKDWSKFVMPISFTIFGSDVFS